MYRLTSAIPILALTKFQDGCTNRQQMELEDNRSRYLNEWNVESSCPLWLSIAKSYSDWLSYVEETRWRQLNRRVVTMMNDTTPRIVEEVIHLYLDSIVECDSYVSSQDRYVCCNYEHDHEFYRCQLTLEEQDYRCLNKKHRHYLWIQL